MSRARAKFTQADVARALKGANDAGMKVRVEIEPGGKIIIMPVTKAIADPVANEWDGAE